MLILFSCDSSRVCSLCIGRGNVGKPLAVFLDLGGGLQVFAVEREGLCEKLCFCVIW